MFNHFWFIALFAFMINFFAVFLAVRFFPRLGLLDRPWLYGLKRAPIPYYGGVAVFLGFLLSVLIFVPLDLRLMAFLFSLSAIVVLGFFDDFWNLSPLLRIFVQLFAAVILLSVGVVIEGVNVPFLGFWDFGILGFWLTIFWLIALTNVMNFLDGVSGLNSGVSFVAGLTLFFLSINPAVHENLMNQQPVAILSLILAMSALAFLFFDFPKARILMGDSGSTFFGFALGALAIFSGGKLATAFLVLGVPILDMVWVVVRRLFSGRKIWQGDRGHLHHRLLDYGFSERGVVVLYFFIAMIFGFGAIFLVSAYQKFFLLLALLFFMLLLIFALLLPKR